ncbi:autotransporter outer membrane beta-barrel domain-containing protein [Histophilus somni]|uniref:autotransporter outer membrane beta-barrel domain-containing protein n=1 Tax=Histophilus somni TaxID=731 RepID=UPI00201F6085|nr:autotransporter outer membrane beta-barrel domain-containing protein [Histophilus somni]
MNTIFKIKWNVVTQCYAVCSELVKRAGKPVGSAVVLSVISVGAMAESVSINNTSAKNEAIGKEYSSRGDIQLDDINITMKPAAGTTWAIPKGLIVRGNTNANITGKTTIDVTLASENNPGRSADSNASYGIAVGYENAGGSATDKANLTLTDADITVTATENTTTGFVSLSGATALSSHQLSAVRVYRAGTTTGTTALPTFTSTGTLNVNIADKTNTKNGDYLVGIYASGEGTKVELHNSNIKVVANGPFSAALKIGKPNLPNPTYADSYEGATIISKGKMVLDTTETAESATVRLFGNKSALIANSASSSSEIKSGNTAILFDTTDYSTDVTLFITDKVHRNENGKDQVVKLNNAVITTTSDTASLIKAQSAKRFSFAVTIARDHVTSWFNNGTFTTQGSFTLSGKESLATAAKDGWLFEVDDGSELTALINKKAKVVGLSSKKPSGTLNVTLDDATWVLKAKEHGAPKSTLNKLTLNSHAVLDASAPTDAAVTKSVYTVKLTSDGTKTDGILTNNSGVISLANKSYQDVLTIEGNYVGNNGVIKLNTNWNSPVDDVDGSDSHSDLVEIKGDASGTTTVQAIKADGTENVIDGSIGSIAEDLNKNSAVLIKVHGTDKGNDVADTAEGGYKYRSTFTGEAKTTGAGVLKLASRKNNKGHTEYFWTLTSINTNNINLDPVVPAYVLAPKVGLELGYTALATLHERRGKDQTAQVQGQTWGRVIGKHLALDGKNRLGAKHHSYGFQFGHDFAIQRTMEGGQYLTGAYVSYGTMNSTYNDRFDDKPQTGKGKQKGWSLGLTHTRYAPSGAYVDLVGQIGFLNNQFNARNGVEAKQKGTALALSAEIGLPYALREYPTKGVWLIEPQAQLVYQMLKLNSFKDDVKYIQGGYHHGLRGRLGVRAVYNVQSAEGKYRPNSVYITANVLHDFMNGKGVTIGQDKVKETLAKTWAEVGVGGQLPVGKQSHVYADVRYEHSLSGTKHEGYRGTVGFKYTWK